MASLQTHGIFVITDPPTGLDFGIDCMSYETGPNFKGMSLIPAGLHFIYHSTGMGSRLGQFVSFAKGEVVVRCWDSSNEEISSSNTLSSESTRLLHLAIIRGDLNEQLGPYPYNHYSTWQNLSNLITLDVLRRSDCSPGTPLYPGDSEDIQQLQKECRGRYSNNNNIQPSTMTPFFPNAARIARFVDIRNFEIQAIEKCAQGMAVVGGSAHSQDLLTQLNIDKSAVLETIIETYFDNNWAEFLGEFQLSFVVFVFLYSFPAMEQWKKTLRCIVDCDHWLSSRPDFTIAFIRILFEHLKFCPEDFFQDDDLSKDNFLEPVLASLFRVLADVQDHAVAENRRRLLTFAQNRFGILHANSAWVNYATESCCDSRIVSMLSRHPLIGDDVFNVGDEDMPVIVGYTDDTADNHINDNSNNNNNSNNSNSNHEDYWQSVDSSFQEIQEGSSHCISTSGSTSNLVRSRPTRLVAIELDEVMMNTSIEAPLAAANDSLSGWRSADDDSNNSLDNILSKIQIQATNKATSSDNSDGPCGFSFSSAQKESAMYGWRYPVLYNAMQSRSGVEDMLMTATRVIDEYKDCFTVFDNHVRMEQSMFANVKNSSDRTYLTNTLKSLILEARMFIEFEAAISL